MKPPVKVLYVDHYSFVGGGQQNLCSVFKSLDRKRYQPLLALPHEGPFAERARALKVPVHIVPMGKARWRLFWQAWPAKRRLRQLMKDEGVGLVHANCYPANKLAGPAARPLGIPVLWHKQIAVTQKPGSTTAWLWAWFSTFNTRVLAVSKQGFDALAALGVQRDKLRLLYNNADIDALAKAKRLPLSVLGSHGIPAKATLVLAAGMRRPHKGFDILLRAFKAFVSAGKSKAHLVLLGDAAQSEPAHEALLQQLAADPALQGRLHVLPSQPALAPWLKRAALFVSSSRWEGSPLVVIEAMAAGTPVLATKSGAGEILRAGKTGTLVPTEDADALAVAMHSCLQRPVDLKRMARAAKAEAAQRFSLKRYVQDLMALYDEMLAP